MKRSTSSGLNRLYRDRMRELQRGGDQGRLHRLNTRRQQLEAAYQQTAGAIAGLYEFAPDAEGVDNGAVSNTKYTQGVGKWA